MTIQPPQKICLALSGGVDSSVSAMCLRDAGFMVEALFMKNWETDDHNKHCHTAEDHSDAAAVCARLNIPLQTANFAQEYWDTVFTHFLAEYQAGRTPNPDILCNKEIKFKALLDHALEKGFDAIATGHYVQKKEVNGIYQLHRGLDQNKDQSYFLYTLNQDQLAKSLFPIGHLEKPTVRQMAENANLITFDKKDSTGICFIGERKFKTFLNEFLLAQPGEMRTPEGDLIGQHDGVMFYTLGQRQGLNIGGKKEALDAPWYVVDKIVKTNTLIVAQGHDHPLLFAQSLSTLKPHWISNLPPFFPIRCTAKIRYRQHDQACEVRNNEHGGLDVVFDEPQRAITPGQSIVFYEGSQCLGGAVIV